MAKNRRDGTQGFVQIIETQGMTEFLNSVAHFNQIDPRSSMVTFSVLNVSQVFLSVAKVTSL